MKIMTLGGLIQDLEACNQDADIMFDFGYFEPSHLMSWRGIYAELALGYKGSTFSSKTKVKAILKDAKQAVGRVYEGYKGGDFEMNHGTRIHIDNYGEYSETHLVGIGIQWGTVILRTVKGDCQANGSIEVF